MYKSLKRIKTNKRKLKYESCIGQTSQYINNGCKGIVQVVIDRGLKGKIFVTGNKPTKIGRLRMLEGQTNGDINSHKK